MTLVSRVVVAASLVIAWIGWAGAAAESGRNVAGARCGKGPMRPVTVRELVRVFRSNGVSLHVESGCMSRPILAQARNVSSGSPERDRAVERREGDVLCMIEPSSVGNVVTRARYPGDAQTYFHSLNVLCAVFPSSDAHAAEQIGRVERAMDELLRTHGGPLEPSSVLARRLVRAFREMLDVGLEREANPTVPGAFPVTLLASAASRKRYGPFQLVVYDTPQEPKNEVYGQRPDVDGIYWTNTRNQPSGHAPYWAAEKIHGRVLLRWWHSRKHVSDAWRRLDAALSGVVGP